MDPNAVKQYIKFAEQEAWKIKNNAKSNLQIKSVGVLGSGTMGQGIAMNFLNVGVPVILCDVSDKALDNGVKIILKNYMATAKKGRLTEDQVKERMALLTKTTDMSAFSTVDLVIEAVFENMKLKKEIFGKLDKICKPGCILASNTSALDIDEIASATSRPQSVIGLHFFSPANVMRLLEVVRGKQTSPEVIAASMDISKKIGKQAVLVGNCFGFVGNRMLFPRQDTAMEVIATGQFTPMDIEKPYLVFGWPMGPLGMSDLAGLDIGWMPETSKPKEILRDALVESGRRGQKTGKGWFDYDPATRRPAHSDEVQALIKQFAKQTKLPAPKDGQEILERGMYRLVNEGAKILDEGMASRASDIDVVWLNGYGFPRAKGGPMYWASHEVGLDKIVNKLQEWAKQDSSYAPCNLLVKLAKEGKTFDDYDKVISSKL